MINSYKSLQGIRVVAETGHFAGNNFHFVAPPPQTEYLKNPVGHFRAYKPQPFTLAERSSTTILLGGLHWRVERVIQGAMENLGYNVQILPVSTREDLLTGREVADIGQCCPTSFTTGTLTNFLRREVQRRGAEEVARRYVYLTAGACGSCRFGQYHHSYELALQNMGMESFRILMLDQEKFDQGPVNGGGLDLGLPLTLGLFWSIVLTDLVMDIEYKTRPYEINPGETNRVSRAAIEYLHDVFLRRPLRGKKLGALLWHYFTDYFEDAMREVKERFDQIEVDRLRVKPIVKITGEFYLQTVEGEPNYNMHHWLEAEGAEVYPASISVWIDYLWRLTEQNAEDHIGISRNALKELIKVRFNQKILRSTYARMRHAMGDAPREMIDQYEIRKLAEPYYHSRMNGGEGDMLIGKALWAYHHKKAHMICELSPYSCMPNTMSVGAMAAVIGRHSDLLYAPVEVKGDAEVHALSRCQMILTEAKKRAQTEYQETLERSGFTETSLREALDSHPEMKSATYRVPHYGVVGTAANLILHLAARRQS